MLDGGESEVTVEERVRPFCRRLLYMIPVCAADLTRLRFRAAFGTICVGEMHGVYED